MEYEEVKKSLWHAFDVLDKSSHARKTRTTQVPKTKLRVLTNNLGQIMKVEHAETIWDKVVMDPLTFDQFVTVLTNNLLIGLSKSSDPTTMSLRSQIDDLCWMLCENSYKQRISSTSQIGEDKKNLRQFSSPDCFKLWKIFNFLSEWSADGSLLIPLRVDVEETERLAREICQAVGLPAPTPTTSHTSRMSIAETTFLQDFSDFICTLAERLGREDPSEVLSQGIQEVYSQIMHDYVHKGHLVKYGNKVTAWKDRWFVLTATELKYFSSSEEKDLKGTIPICEACFTQSFPDKPGGRQHRFKLHTPTKQYELSAPDLKSKNQWMSDIKRVISTVGKTKDSLQRLEWKERRKEREERRRRTAEDELRRLAEKEKLLQREMELEEERKQRQLAEDEIKERERLLELEQKKRQEEEERRQQETQQLLSDKQKEIADEKQRFADIEQRLKEEREALMQSCQEALVVEREQRAKVEDRLRQEEAELEEERRRLKELEDVKASLEALLEEERALKRDEEIVRNLQAKILEEETAKREELEQLQEEQRQQLLQEKLSRQELEAVRREQAEALAMAQKQLEEISKDREQAELRMKEATDKLSQAETDRQVLEQRLKLRDMISVQGLAKPLPKRDPNPFVTHRGLGAFTEADFVPSPPHGKRTQSPKWDDESHDLKNDVSDGTRNVSLDGDEQHHE